MLNNQLNRLIPRGHFFDRFSLMEKANIEDRNPSFFKKIHNDPTHQNCGTIDNSPVILDITDIDREKILEQKKHLLSILPRERNDLDWKYISSYLELDKIKKF